MKELNQLIKEINRDIEEIEVSELFLDFVWKYFIENPPSTNLEDELTYSTFGFQVGDIITLENGKETFLLKQLGNVFLAADIDENEIPTGALHIVEAILKKDGTYISVLDTKLYPKKNG
ncbi:MAG: hypothetical protein ACI4FV_11095 [Lachnospiraceae bacterium]